MRAFFHSLSLLLLGVLIAQPAYALSLIRDAETEALLRDYSDPIFEAAGLEPSSVNIFIVNDPTLNAFVAGGANMFIHTGLIMASKEPETLIGVIAHETGHIAGGHLARGTEALKDAQLSTILSYVLGAAAGLAGGGEAAAGILSAGQHVTQRNILSFTRVNEQAADQAALSYLDKTNISPEGMLSLMEKLRSREQLYRTKLDPYALTHPLSKERIAHVRGHLLKQNKKAPKLDAETMERHARVLGKLKGFLNDPEILLQATANEKTSDKLTRIVAAHRLSKTEDALKGIDELLVKEPKNPYFLELKAQILSETGRHSESRPYIQKALSLKPDSGLLRTDYARVLMSQKNADFTLAAKELSRASQQDHTNALTWQLLGQAEAEIGHNGKAALAYAEAALLRSDGELARRYATEALDKLPKTSPAMLRAQDAREEAIRLQREKKEKAS
ncbi:MAG: M48 family metalloprotease [Rickettsiales bacterium]|nr:M48 family metalloprotease [Rickettsiales bacterium]